MSILLSLQVFASTFSPTSLIKHACDGLDFEISDYNFCVETLASEPGIVSATNLLSLSIALIDAGISNATKTLSYIQKVVLKHPGLKPDYRYKLQQCDAAYNYYLTSLKSALIQVNVKDYETANHDLDVAVADGIIGQCNKAFGYKKIKDGVIYMGNRFSIEFGEVAINTVGNLEQNKRI